MNKIILNISRRLIISKQMQFSIQHTEKHMTVQIKKIIKKGKLNYKKKKKIILI